MPTTQSSTTIDRRLAHIESLMEGAIRTKPADKFWDVATKAMVPFSLAVIGWAVSVESRVSRNSDNLNHLPPEWLQRALVGIETAVGRNSDKLDNLAERVAAIEAKVK